MNLNDALEVISREIAKQVIAELLPVIHGERADNRLFDTYGELMSRAQVAEELGVSTRQVQNIEHNLNRVEAGGRAAMYTTQSVKDYIKRRSNGRGSN